MVETRNKKGMAGVLTPLGRMYSSLERDMITAFALSCPFLIVAESPKDGAGVFAPMDGMIYRCKGPDIEVAYVYEAKTRNFSAATLFGQYGGRAMIKSAKLGNAQRAALLFAVPALAFIRLQGEAFYLVKRLVNPDGTFTFKYNERFMRTQKPCGRGLWEETYQSYVPMHNATRMKL